MVLVEGAAGAFVHHGFTLSHHATAGAGTEAAALSDGASRRHVARSRGAARLLISCHAVNQAAAVAPSAASEMEFGARKLERKPASAAAPVTSAV